MFKNVRVFFSFSFSFSHISQFSFWIETRLFDTVWKMEKRSNKTEHPKCFLNTCACEHKNFWSKNCCFYECMIHCSVCRKPVIGVHCLSPFHCHCSVLKNQFAKSFAPPLFFPPSWSCRGWISARTWSLCHNSRGSLLQWSGIYSTSAVSLLYSAPTHKCFVVLCAVCQREGKMQTLAGSSTFLPFPSEKKKKH